jgi:hypothetical protein
MIPVEIYWGTLIVVFGLIGMARGLWKELGTSAVLLLSLFALFMGQQLILSKLVDTLGAGALASAPEGTIQAIYYSMSIIFVAFISYQGITLEFPVARQGGLLKWFFGFFGGLLNGYLIVGTVWDVIAQADYLGLTAPGQQAPISATLSGFHNSIVQYLPVSLMQSNEFVAYVFLAVGMIMLLAIILK